MKGGNTKRRQKSNKKSNKTKHLKRMLMRNVNNYSKKINNRYASPSPSIDDEKYEDKDTPSPNSKYNRYGENLLDHELPQTLQEDPDKNPV